MAKKAKKRTNQMPRLSLVDKLIYWIIMLVLICLYFLLYLIPVNLHNRIAFEEASVIASYEKAGFLWFLIPWMTFFLMTFILWVVPYENRRPIFGIRNFKYGPPAWPKIYPLFMKNKPYVYVGPQAKKGRKHIAIFLVILLLLSFLPFPLCLYGRKTLHNNGSITEHNAFNQMIHSFYAGECKEVQIGTFRYSTGRYNTKTHWGVKMTFIMENGRKYVFDHRDFRRDTQTDICYWLTAMLNIKGRHRPEIISYHGTDKLDRVISNRNLSEAEQALLYQLFQP